MPFDGQTYDPAQDRKALTGQLLDVYAIMKDGRMRSLRHIADLVSGSEAGVSARLRDLRKDKFGGHDVQKKRNHGTRLWMYWIVPPPPANKQGTLFPMGSSGPF